MPGASIDLIIRDVQVNLDHPTEDDLPLVTILPVLQQALEFYNLKLELSARQVSLIAYPFQPRAQEINIPDGAADFSEQKMVEVLNRETGRFERIADVELAELEAYTARGELAVSIAGGKMRFSWNPTADTVKLWYEPQLAGDITDLQQKTALPTYFRGMVAHRTALKLMPYLRRKWFRHADRLAFLIDQAETMTAELQQWEREFEVWRLTAPNLEPMQKVGYHERRRRC